MYTCTVHKQTYSEQVRILLYFSCWCVWFTVGTYISHWYLLWLLCTLLVYLTCMTKYNCDSLSPIPTCNVLDQRLHTLHATNMYSLVLVQRNKLLLISSFEKVLKREYHYIMDSCRNLHRETPLPGHAITTHTNTLPYANTVWGLTNTPKVATCHKTVCLLLVLSTSPQYRHCSAHSFWSTHTAYRDAEYTHVRTYVSWYISKSTLTCIVTYCYISHTKRSTTITPVVAMVLQALFRTVLRTYIHVVSGEVSTTPPEVGRGEGLDRNTQRQCTSTTHCSHSRLCCLHICAAHAVIQTAYVRGSIGSKLIVLLLYVTIVCYVTTDDVCLNVACVILLLLPSLTR